MAELSFLTALSSAIVPRQKAGPPVPVSENRGGWWPLIHEADTGYWQRNITVELNSVVANPIVFACMSRIATDFGSMPNYLESKDSNGIWSEIDKSNPAYTPVLRKPNRYQTHIQFKEAWALSKLFRGNTYALKERDNRNVVVRLYILDPARVKAMVSDDGSVWYSLSADNMAGGELTGDVMVPASEIIHDRYNCLFHPLLGTSPLFAAGVAATQSLNMQNASTYFFGNKSMPGGILTAPGSIAQETADRLKATWQAGFSGDNAGKIAVLGDGLKFERLTMSAGESQFVEQLKWTSDAICAAFAMPPYIVNLAPWPSSAAGADVEAALGPYYSTCLKGYVLAYEECMNDGLNLLGGDTRVQLDEETLLRMNKSALYKAMSEGIRGGFLAPNEARRMDNRKPLPGGDTVYLQEQDHSLAALSARDEGDDPFGKGNAAPASEPDNDNDLTEDEAVKAAQAYSYLELKALPPPVRLLSPPG